MTFSQGVSLFLVWNLLFATAFGLLLLRELGMRARQATSDPRTELRLHLAVWAAPFVLCLLFHLIPNPPRLLRLSEVDAAPSLNFYQGESTYLDTQGYVSIRGKAQLNFPVAKISAVMTAVISLLTLLGITLLFRDGYRVMRLIRRSYYYRKCGRVRIWLNDEAKIPFSFWLPRTAHVVIPTYLVETPAYFRASVLHELQHHRNRDTLVIYFIWLTRLIGVFNPAIHYWARWLFELQEFACDATLVDRNIVDSRQYSRCLFEVAQQALGERCAPACATGLAFFFGSTLLKRRIQKMNPSSRSSSSRSIPWKFVSVAAILLSLTAAASHGFIQDRRITASEAQSWVSRHQKESDFPLVVNDLVLNELNHYVGTPDGREYMRQAIARMKDYAPILERKLEQYHAPRELLAVPIIESGYQNLPDSNKLGWGAGLWMFMKQTARAVGLTVDEIRDERLDVDLLTDAAMRLLIANRLRFNDWSLSLLAYNWGENALQTAMNKAKSRDAWVLIRKGLENDKGYLAKFTAAALILKNPQVLD